MLLRVLGLASGICLALGPEFPEVAHRSPSLNWSGGGGHIPIRGAPYIYNFVCVMCVCVCVCVCVFMCTQNIVRPFQLVFLACF